MANLNRVDLIGRLTHDPDEHTFPSGSKTAKIRFAVNNRRKNSSGQWEDEACYISIDAYGRLAELCLKYLRKGSSAYISGHLRLDSWTDKETGKKQSLLKVIAEHVQFLDGRKQEHQEGHWSERPGAAAFQGDEQGIPF